MAAMAVMRNLPAPRIHLIDAGVRKHKYAARTLRRKPAEPKWRRRKAQKRKDGSESNAAAEEPQEPTHPLTPAEEKEAKKKEKKEKEREEEEADMNGERESRDLHRLRRLFFRLCFCRDLCECVIANFGGIFWCTLIIAFSLLLLGVGNITLIPLRSLHTFLDVLHTITAPLRTVVGGVIKGIGAVVGWIFG